MAKNGWWYAKCPKHGITAHMAVLDGRCATCQNEELEAKGLLATEEPCRRR